MLSYKTYDLLETVTKIVNGEVVRDSVVTGSVIGSLQPLTVKEADQLPENMRTSQMYKLYSRKTSVLINGTYSDGTAAIGDEVDTPFGLLRVVGVEQHLPTIVDTMIGFIAHNKYILVGDSGG